MTFASIACSIEYEKVGFYRQIQTAIIQNRLPGNLFELHMPDISLITSLYRSEAYLPQYIQHVRDVATTLHKAHITLEIVIVVNDATPAEEQLLQTLQAAVAAPVQVISVPRETLYASWNRGINAAQGDILGFWNVDDLRTADGLLDGYRRFHADDTLYLVDFPFFLHDANGEIAFHDTQFNPVNFSPKAVAAPFFLFRRTLYEQAGSFNENFRITGDYEWSKREIVRQTRYVLSDTIAGKFLIHDTNLSTGNNPLEWVELDTVLIWHSAYEHLRPVEPDLMYSVWHDWGHIGGTMPDDIAEWLWGEGARDRYEAYNRERNAHPLLRRIRLALARRGLWHSVEWDAHHRW